MYQRIDETTPLRFQGTVTLVFFSLSADAGAFSISAWSGVQSTNFSFKNNSDVSKFSFLQFLYYDNLGGDNRFVVDATNGTAAVTLFQGNQDFDTVVSYILSVLILKSRNATIQKANTNFSIYAGGIPLAPNQLLSTYG